jgi:hypothetical protein
MRQQKKIALITCLFLVSMMTACNGDRQLPQRNSDTVCPADVHQCDDGHHVSRDPNNNCEFNPCRSQ